MSRTIKIGAALFLALSIILLAALGVFLESDAFDRLVRKQIISYLETRFRMHVSINRVDVRLFSTEVELQGLRIFSMADSSLPAIDIDGVLVNFSITRFLGPSASLDKVHLDSPRIRLVREANNRLNLANIFVDPNKQKTGKPFSITRLAIKQLEMRDGLVLVERRPIHVETAEGGLDVTWRFLGSGKKGYGGQVGLDRLDIAVGDFSLNDTRGAVHFTLFDNEVLLPHVDIDSREMHIEASGGISDLRRMFLRMETRVIARLPLITSPNLGPYIDRGEALATGIFSNDASGFLWKGKVQSPLLEFLDFPLQNFQSQVTVTPEGVRVEQLRARLYTGAVKAGGVLAWDAGDRSQFEVDAQDVGLRPLMLQFDLEEIGLSGKGTFKGAVGWPGFQWKLISGQGTASYSGFFTGYGEDSRTPSLETEGDSGKSRIPFEGRTAVMLGGETVRLNAGVVQLPESKVEYTGAVGFTGVYDLDFVTDSGDASELFSVARLTGLVPEEAIRRYGIEPAGPTSFTARLYEERGSPCVQATVRVHEVLAGRESLGSVQAAVRIDPDVVQLNEVRLKARDFNAALTAKLRWGDRSDELNQLDLRMHNVPIGRFLPLLRPGLPVEGVVAANVRFEETTRNHYQGGGKILVRNGNLYGEPVGPIQAEIDFQKNQVFVQRLSAKVASGTVTGQAALNLETRSAKIDVQGRGLSLQSINSVRERTEATGLFDFSITGSGTLAHPDFEVRLTTPVIALEAHRLEKVAIRGTVKGRAALFELENVFQDQPFRIDGSIHLDPPYNIEASIELNQVPIAPYLSLFGRNLPDFKGIVQGVATLSGPVRNPEQLTAKAKLSLLQLQAEKVQISNTAPFELSFGAGALHIPPVTFRGPLTELRVEGDLTLKQPRSIIMKADGKVNLVLLNGFMTSGSAGGQLQLNTIVTGPLSRPRIAGSAQLKEGLLNHPSMPGAIFNADGSFKFTANQVSIDEFSARTTYGVVSAAGGVFLEGLRPARWQVNIAGSGLRFEYPKNLVSIVDVDIDSIKGESAHLLSGAVYIRSAEYSENISIPELIMNLSGPQSAEISRGAAGDQTQLNISVEAYQSIRVNNNLAEVTASGDFNIRGTLENPLILGSLTIDQGALTLENNDFEVTRGTVTFNDPRRIRPVFNFEASTEKLEYTITVAMRGPIERLNMSLRSDPPLPTSTILSLLVTTTRSTSLTQTQEEVALGGQRQAGSLAVYGAGTLLSKSLGETVEARASRLFGFEKLSIDPFFNVGSRDPAARVTLGKELASGLTVTYQTVLGNPQQEQFVSLEYKLTDWLTAIGTREENGSLAIDFKFRKRF